MSEDNTEIVRRAIEAFSRGDLDLAFQDLAPDATFDFSRSRGLDAGVYAGRDAIRRLWTEMTEPFTENTWVPGEFIRHREHVVVSITARMTGRGGIQLEARTATVATLRDGRIVRLTMYQDEAEALKAVGLEDAG